MSQSRKRQKYLKRSRKKERIYGAEWNGVARTKASDYADKGFTHEVRLKTLKFWSYKPDGHNEAIELVRRNCGHSFRIINRKRKRKCETRIYLSSESDLMLLRVSGLEGIFRVYKLTRPSDSPQISTER